MRTETFAPECSVERFNEGIIRWLARPREIDPDVILMSPKIHRLTCEFAAVVTEQELGRPAPALHMIQYAHHIGSFQASGCFDSQAFPGINVHYRQRPEPASVGQLVGNKI